MLYSLYLLGALIPVVLANNDRDRLVRKRALKAPALGVLSSRDDCVSPDPADTVTDRLNILLNSSGPGYVLSLCQSANYLLVAPLMFTAHDQEISTVGYPIANEEEDKRATLFVTGPTGPTFNHTTAIVGSCPDCDGIKIRNLRINGTRGDGPILTGGGNIEIGGSNTDQLVEYTHSSEPRGWSCFHVFEGSLDCTNTTIRYNDIGPCGHDTYFQWSDGISLSCRNSHVHGNWINSATDGAIVLFGSPGSVVENNTIWTEDGIMLGGINMVDYDPFGGDYRGTIVRNNTIRGGFATSLEDGADDSRGTNNVTAFIKLGIAIGPRTWFGQSIGDKINDGGAVLDNMFTGAFGFAIGANSANNWTISGNVLFGNTSFIGARGVNCSQDDENPTPQAFVYDQNRVTNSNGTGQVDLVGVPNADGLNCIDVTDGEFWPFGGQPTPYVPGEEVPTTPSGSGGGDGGSGGQAQPSSGGSDKSAKIGMGVGIPLGVIAAAIGAFFFRRWYLNQHPRGGARMPPMAQQGYSRST